MAPPHHPLTAGKAVRRYTPAEVEEALLELALCGGNSGEAHRRLSARGLDVSEPRLRAWRRYDHAERYVQLCNQHAKQVEQTIVAKARENARKAADVISQAIDKAAEQVESGKVDAAKTALSLATAQGIQIDKALVLEGRPTVITERRDAEDILRSLNEMVPGLVIDSTATELPTKALQAKTSAENAGASN
jgi:hypothetical protein